MEKKDANAEINEFLKSKGADTTGAIQVVNHPERVERKPLDNNCLNCRWLKASQLKGKCPATGKKINKNKPIKNCKRFREYQGEYYI